MTVTIDYGQLGTDETSCLPTGRSRHDYEIHSGRDVRLVPGNTFSLTLRVTAGDAVEVLDIAADGTIETNLIHGFKVGDPIHLCFYTGVALTPVSPWLQVLAVIDDHHFTIEDSKKVPVKIQKEVILKAGATQPVLCGWVAKAANLKGFQGRIVVDLDTGRRDVMLGVAAIKKGTTQLQLKGTHDLKKGDTITLGTYRSCVRMSMTATIGDDCYTVVEMAAAATEDIKFTQNLFALLEPYEPKIEAYGAGDSWGWVNVTMPGRLTHHLMEYKKPTIGDCPQYVGNFRMELLGVTIQYPSWFKVCNNTEPTFTRVFDWGRIWV